MKAAGDHQVEHEPEIVVEADGDAFADAAQAGHFAALDGAERRIDSAQQERAGDAHRERRATDYAGLEGAER